LKRIRGPAILEVPCKVLFLYLPQQITSSLIVPKQCCTGQVRQGIVLKALVRFYIYKILMSIQMFTQTFPHKNSESRE
jgi:hypothetical protein